VEQLMAPDKSESSNIICPLFGEEQLFSRKLFTQFNPDELLIVRSAQDEPDPDRFCFLKGIRLTKIPTSNGLLWLKRQVVLRCTEIIQKLAV